MTNILRQGYEISNIILLSSIYSEKELNINFDIGGKHIYQEHVYQEHAQDDMPIRWVQLMIRKKARQAYD